MENSYWVVKEEVKLGENSKMIPNTRITCFNNMIYIDGVPTVYESLTKKITSLIEEEMKHPKYLKRVNNFY